MSYTNCNRLPGVVAVKWVEAERLAPHLVEKYIAGIPVAIGTDGTELQLVSPGSTEGLTQWENNGLISKATLEFRTLDDVPQRQGVAWAVKDASGAWWLIGAKERPYPVVEVTRATGDPGTAAAVATVKVTHTAKMSLIPAAW